MNVSNGLLTVAGVAAMLWIAVPAASHGPGAHSKPPMEMSGDAMKAQHERMVHFKEAAEMLSDAIIHNMMKMAHEGAEKLDQSLQGHERDIPHKNRTGLKEFRALYLELDTRTEKLKAAIQADNLPKAAVAYGRILETCATCHGKFRD